LLILRPQQKLSPGESPSEFHGLLGTLTSAPRDVHERSESLPVSPSNSRPQDSLEFVACNIVRQVVQRRSCLSPLLTQKRKHFEEGLVTPSVVPISILQASPCFAIAPVPIPRNWKNTFSMTICRLDWSPNSRAGRSVYGRPREVLRMLMLPSPSKYPATWVHDSYGGAISLDFTVNYEGGSELVGCN